MGACDLTKDTPGDVITPRLIKKAHTTHTRAPLLFVADYGSFSITPFCVCLQLKPNLMKQFLTKTTRRASWQGTRGESNSSKSDIHVRQIS